MPPALPPTLTEAGLDVTREAIGLYARITNDMNPIHIDEAFAATTPMGGVIAHGTMGMALIWQSVVRSLGEDAILGADLTVNFNRPARPGDRLTAGGAILEGERLGYTLEVANSAGEGVMTGELMLAGDPE